MAAAGGHLHGAFGVFLPFDLAEILTILAAAGKKLFQVYTAGVNPFATGEEFHHLGKGRGADDLEPRDHGCFRGVLQRQDDAFQTRPLGGHGHGQCPPDRLEAAIQREFTQQAVLLKESRLDNPGGRQDTDGDRQVVGGTLFLDVSRRQVGGDATGRKIIAGILECRPDTILTLLDRPVRQPDCGEGRQTWSQVNLYINQDGIDTDQSAAENLCEHF